LVQRRNYPCGTVVEVYDHAEPAPRDRKVGTVEALAPGERIVFSVVGAVHHGQNRFDMIKQPAPPTLGEVKV
jgi:hypothetical protein